MRLLHALTRIDFEMTKEERRQADLESKKNNENNKKGGAKHQSPPSLPNIEELKELAEEMM